MLIGNGSKVLPSSPLLVPDSRVKQSGLELYDPALLARICMHQLLNFCNGKKSGGSLSGVGRGF